MIIHRSYVAAVLAVGLASLAEARVSLAPPFADNMVLQRDRPAAVWGKAETGEVVSVSFAGQTVKALAGSDGRWSLHLAALPASNENRELVAAGRDNAVTVKNVLVGEVWLCSGQSNMELPLWGNNPRFRDVKGAFVAQIVDDPRVRFARLVPHGLSAKPCDDFPITWQAVRPDTVAPLSAISFYFGMTLNRVLGVPVGLITSHWGGTRIEPWTPPCGFESVPELKAISETIATLELPPKTSWPGNYPAVLFNRMINPLVPYTFRGVIWYQGEANLGETNYCAKMHALFNGWSQVFENPDMKFYFAQLAPFTYEDNKTTALPESWRQQQKFVTEEPRAGMAMTSDIGNLGDIHPNEKELVGLRLAMLALKRDYGLTHLKADAPTFKSATVSSNVVTVTFNHAASFYVYGPTWSKEDAQVRGFRLAGHDGRFVDATAVIKGNDAILLTAPGVSVPRSVSFMGSGLDVCTLHNEVGLPPVPFAVDL